MSLPIRPESAAFVGPLTDKLFALTGECINRMLTTNSLNQLSQFVCFQLNGPSFLSLLFTHHSTEDIPRIASVRPCPGLFQTIFPHDFRFD
jgi:hypothetical protein